MAKMKLTLAPLPDFKLPVDFTLPTGDQQRIVFTVKHIKVAEFQELYSGEREVRDSELIMHIASGWDLEEEFNEDNAKLLVELFPGSAIALAAAYLKALAGQRVKN